MALQNNMLKDTPRYNRQMDIVDVDKLSIPIHVIGVGGIGSWTTMLLAKMGCSNITVYDFDEVEDHNVASQFYKSNQLGFLKTESLRSNVIEQTDITIKIGDVEKEKDISEGIVIIAVDSMKMRRELNEMFKDKDLFIIDGRMGGLQAEVYCAIASKYEPTLVANDDEVEHEICTAKAISFNCAIIGGMITNYVRLYVNEMLDLSLHSERTFLFDNVWLLKPKKEHVSAQ